MNTQTQLVAELVTTRGESRRLSLQTGAAAIAVIVVCAVDGAITGLSGAWELSKALSKLWCTFYVFRSMLAWHRIDKAGRS